MLRLLLQRGAPRTRPVYSRNYLSFNAGSSQDYYNLLGVKRDATQRQIKAAYYELSKKYHPDVAGSSASASGMFVKISEAYECLRDPNRRRAYDNERSGGGGRYTGDRSDPFNAFYQRQGNPFHSSQFTQSEYERIWKEFNRLRNQRDTYNQRMEYERQRMWMELAKKRAERWQQFHQRYPNGPPGSIKWEWRWSSQDQQPINRGWELVKRILLVYFTCFVMISFVQVVFFQLGDVSSRRQPIVQPQPAKESGNERDKIEAMMTRRPAPNTTSYMQIPPEIAKPPPSAVPSEQLVFEQGREVSYSDGAGSQFSVYESTDGKKMY